MPAEQAPVRHARPGPVLVHLDELARGAVGAVVLVDALRRTALTP
jgi:hypothetical protein